VAEDLSNHFSSGPSDPLPQVPKKAANTNDSVSMLQAWNNNGHTTKSVGELNSLVHDVLLNPKFKLEDLKGFNAARAEKQAEKDAVEAFPLLQDFQKADMKLRYHLDPPTFRLAKFLSRGYIIQALFR
jgi:hypothetical protein